ncbi:MAG: hypothetical protein M5U33_09400 [Pseudorhodoplanes sp.]|nr:hypothetical protein [Pseudorhodoplanes sp.]
MGAVSRSISGVSQAAGQTGDAAAQVLAAASELTQHAERLKSEMAAQVDEFLNRNRAA